MTLLLASQSTAQPIDLIQQFDIAGSVANEALGSDAKILGDVNSDGIFDVAVTRYGAESSAGAADSKGKVAIVSGADGAVLA